MNPAAPRPWLSVVLTVYQGARHLPDALAGLEGAGAGALEILALDDGSTDGSLALLEAARARLPIRVLSDGAHSGNWVARMNEGLRAARGEWISLLHHDDAWAPGRMAALRAATARHPSAGLLLHAARFVDDAGRPLGRWGCPLPKNRPLSPATVLPRLASQNFIPFPAACFRRDWAAAAGELDEALWYFADWDYWLRLARLGATVYLPEPWTRFRLHAESQTARRTGDLAEIARQFDAVQDRLSAALAADPSLCARIERARPLARAAYLWLCAAAHDLPRPTRALCAAVWRAGPAGGMRYLRDARLADRLPPRWRLRHRARGRSA
jgi:GT2 family glycosyltransferase